MDTNNTNNNDLKLVAQYTVDAYKAKHNGANLDIIDNPQKPGSIFFACGTLPDGTPNYGAVGEKAKALVAAKAPKEQLRVSVYKTHNKEGKEIELPILQANSTANVVASY